MLEIWLKLIIDTLATTCRTHLALRVSRISTALINHCSTRQVTKDCLTSQLQFSKVTIGTWWPYNRWVDIVWLQTIITTAMDLFHQLLLKVSQVVLDSCIDSNTQTHQEVTIRHDLVGLYWEVKMGREGVVSTWKIMILPTKELWILRQSLMVNLWIESIIRHLSTIMFEVGTYINLLKI